MIGNSQECVREQFKSLKNTFQCELGRKKIIYCQVPPRERPNPNLIAGGTKTVPIDSFWSAEFNGGFHFCPKNLCEWIESTWQGSLITWHAACKWLKHSSERSDWNTEVKSTQISGINIQTRTTCTVYSTGDGASTDIGMCTKRNLRRQGLQHGVALTHAQLRLSGDFLIVPGNLWTLTEGALQEWWLSGLWISKNPTKRPDHKLWCP